MTDRSSVPQVSVIKVKIHEATGMPAGKQKLQYEVSWVSPPVSSLLSQKLSHLWDQEWGDVWLWPCESILEAMLLEVGAGAG